MHTLCFLLLVAAAACAVPRPLGPSAAPSMSQLPHRMGRQPRPFRSDYIMPRMLMPNPLYGYEDSPRAVAPTEQDWLSKDTISQRSGTHAQCSMVVFSDETVSMDMLGLPPVAASSLLSASAPRPEVKEIDRINQMEDDEDMAPFEDEFSRWMSREPYMPRPFGPARMGEPAYGPDTETPVPEYVRALPPPIEFTPPLSPSAPEMTIRQRKTSTPTPTAPTNEEEKKKTFALTPLDKEYYEPEHKIVTQKSDGPHEGGDSKTHKAVYVTSFQRPRQTRQNPNLGRTKNLVSENLDRLRTGLANKDYRIPVSLLPSNLRWLRINPTDATETSTQENPAGTDKPHHLHVLESAADPADSIYGIALIVAVGAALAMAIFGFAFGWYTLSKKAKAAADVDYPAYGVTGPNIDTSGDRKLAHSAHMYHYQHQKQQIIAMERNGCEHRNGSMSDPESEEENEEGDYTVYECPGFATTGDMEVKNPLFSEDPTPSTPGKCEIVKPQPKD